MPAEQVVWLLFGMALFRHLSILQIVDRFGLALQKGRSASQPAAAHTLAVWVTCASSEAHFTFGQFAGKFAGGLYVMD